MLVRSLGLEDALEKEIATHSSILDWKIPWTKELSRLQSMRLQRVRHDWATKQQERYIYSTLDVKVEVRSLSHVRLSVTPRTVAHQAPLSMGFSRQEYWSGLLFPSPGHLPDPGIEPGSPALQADSLLTEPFDTCLKYSVVNERRLWTEGSGYRKLY